MRITAGDISKLFALTLAGSVLPMATAHAGILCTVIADAADGMLLVKEGEACAERVTAASTFKIAISLMGYDSGFLLDRSTPRLPFKQGYADWIPSWRADTDPAGWMKNSVVWYSQQITKFLGDDRFGRYVDAFDYGNGDVSGDPDKKNGLTRSWLSSSLTISPLEQIAFLDRLVNRRFPVTAHAYEMTDAIMALGTLPNGWDIHGKTGAGAPRGADGALDGRYAHGWFVGWASKAGRTVVFARLIQNDGRKEPVSPGIRTREAMMRELPVLLDSL